MYSILQNKERIISAMSKAYIVFTSLLGFNHLIWAIDFFGYQRILKRYLKLADYSFVIGLCFCLCVYCILQFSTENGKKILKKQLKLFFCKEQILLILFCFLSIISVIAVSLLSSSNAVKENIYGLYNLFIEVIILFPLGRYYCNHKADRFIKIIGHSLLIAISIYGAATLVLAFQKRVLYIDNLFPWGINDNHQLCTNCNPNMTGMYYSLVTLICFWMLIVVNKKLLKIIYAFAFLIDFIVLILTNSRGSYIGFTLGVSLIFVIKLYFFISNKSILKRVLFISIIFSASWALLVVLRGACIYLFDFITGYANDLGVPGERNLNVLYTSGRTAIWKYSLKWIFNDYKNILFGCTPSRVIENITIISNGEFSTYTHNEFLEVAMSVGVPGMIIYFLWLLLIAKNCVLLLIEKIKTKYVNMIIPACLVLSVVVMNLVEAYLLFTLNLVGSLFAFICGFVSNRNNI